VNNNENYDSIIFIQIHS